MSRQRLTGPWQTSFAALSQVKTTKCNLLEATAVYWALANIELLITVVALDWFIGGQSRRRDCLTP